MTRDKKKEEGPIVRMQADDTSKIKWPQEVAVGCLLTPLVAWNSEGKRVFQNRVNALNDEDLMKLPKFH